MDDYLSTREAAESLGVSIRRVLALIAAGKLKTQKLGSVHVIAVGDLEAVRVRTPGRPKKKHAPEPAPAKKTAKKRKGKGD